MGRKKIHPYAELFPLMTGAELDALTEDVREHGLRQPVVLFGGMLLDGRNRMAACERAGVEPQFVEHDGDDASALALVISLNVQRRDLTAGQRAITAAKAWGLDGYSKGGRPGKGKPAQTAQVSREPLCHQFKISDNTLRQARDLLADAPDLAEQVFSCALSLASAHADMMDRRRVATQKAKDAERLSEFRDAVSAGDMTWEEALQKRAEEERKKTEDAQARQLFFQGLGAVVKWCQQWVKDVSDEHLTWYALDCEAGPDCEAGVAMVIAQLQRIQAHTFGGNDVQARSKKARP